MKMPVRAFWLMVNNIPRVTAERETRLLTLHVSAQNGEAAKEYRQQLEKDMGTVVVTRLDVLRDPPRDEEGFNWLRSLA